MLFSTSQIPVLFLVDLLNVTQKPSEVLQEPPTLSSGHAPLSGSLPLLRPQFLHLLNEHVGWHPLTSFV